MKPLLIIALGASIILVFIITGLVYFGVGSSTNLLIIHFDSYRGIDFFGSRWDVWSMVAIGLVLTLVNFLLIRVLYHRESFLAYCLAFFTIFLLLLILISVAVITIVN